MSFTSNLAKNSEITNLSETPLRGRIVSGKESHFSETFCKLPKAKQTGAEAMGHIPWGYVKIL